MDNIDFTHTELWTTIYPHEKLNHFLIFEDNNNSNKTLQTILLEEDLITIGRNQDNIIVLNVRGISRYHAHIVKHEEEGNFYYEIIDGDIQGKPSKNGFCLNQIKLQRAILKHGDLITLAPGKNEINLTYYINNIEEILAKKYDNIDDERIKKTISQQYEEIDTVTPDKNSLGYKNNYSLDELLKFASIVNLFPTPIIELNNEGEFTFINAEAKIYFPDLETKKLDHDLLKNLLPFPDDKNFNLYKRDLQIKNNYYEQYIHYLPDLKLLRLYLFNITTIKKQKQLLKDKIDFDFQTQLPNYKFFLNELQRALAIHKRNQRKMGVMIIELDNLSFMKENLSDKLEKDILRELAQRIQKCFREEDIVAYWRNNQFIILLSELDNFKDIGIICQRVFAYTKEPFINENNTIDININIGVSVYPYDAENKEDLIRKADQAIGNIKKYGTNNYALYSPKINFESQQHSRILKNLRIALNQEEFTIYYQPIISYKQQEIIALESLIRWNNPQLGIVYPQDFLELAERSDLISELTWWMLEQIFALRNSFNNTKFQQMPISINLSAKLFTHPLIWQKIIELIKEEQHYSQLLILEVTESVFMQDVTIKEALKQLLNIGVKIALDDFGSQNSSLDILKKFPFHFLKIDQEFTKNIKDNSQDKAIISGINTIAQGFNMKVIAEGIETQQQWDIIKELGCDYGQGYLFSPPLPLNEIYNFLDNFTNFA